jgi:hypothetical protein
MTAKIKRIKLFGEGIYSKSPVVTRQRRLNCYLEVRDDGDKSSIVCYGTPGMKFAFNPANQLNLPMRGMLGTPTALYCVAGNIVKLITSTGQTTVSGTIGTTSGLVGLALNPTQLMVVDGSAGYVFNVATGAVTPAPAAFPNGAQTVTQCNGFFACESPGTNQVFVSNYNDGTTWSGLSFFAAVQAPDGIVAVDSLGGILIPFSNGHVEFWQNVGATQEPFQYITNSASMIGLAAVNSRVHCGDSLLFLGRTNGGGFQNAAGSFQIFRIRGYSVTPVSTTDIDNILQTMAASSTITDCVAFSYQVDKHVFAQFNFPTANRSLLLDTATGFWSEVQSGITQAYAARHIGNLSASAYNQTYIADYSNGNVYNPDPNTYTDNGNTIVREVVSRCAVEDWNSFSISQIYVDMQTGVGLSSPSAQGYNPVVELSIARDGRNFGVPRLFSLGKQGQNTTRVNSRRWGLVRTAGNLRIRMTDPEPFVITGAAIRTRSRAGRQAPSTPAGRAA